MKYMLFITVDPTAPVPEKVGDINEWLDSVKEVRLDGDRLQGAATATSVRSRNGKQVVTDGPFAETKDLIAGWMVIDVDTYERALELAGELSAAPGAGGKPIHEWLEVRPFMTEPPTITE